MTLLSVNVNKVALLRNVRNAGHPSVLEASRICLEAGAGGITVHPRPDQRHIRPEDVLALAALVRDAPGFELNVEGNPFPEFLGLVERTKPTQCTLVPDAPDAITSDHGWDLEIDGPRLRPVIRELQAAGIRVSVFVDPDPAQIARAKEIGADRIELYTESYARAHGTDRQGEVLELFVRAAGAAEDVGLGVNAGHDLALDNLGSFVAGVPNVLEVSIGHALISYSLEVGLRQAVSDYRSALEGRRQRK
jgi:pyridoxine 5-phosphate synthase